MVALSNQGLNVNVSVSAVDLLENSSGRSAASVFFQKERGAIYSIKHSEKIAKPNLLSN
jgi:hypothetical protein